MYGCEDLESGASGRGTSMSTTLERSMPPLPPPPAAASAVTSHAGRLSSSTRRSRYFNTLPPFTMVAPNMAALPTTAAAAVETDATSHDAIIHQHRRGGTSTRWSHDEDVDAIQSPSLQSVTRTPRSFCK